MMKKPLGIYIHIPFCIKKCVYCDFLSAPANKDIINAYVDALINELSNCRQNTFRHQVQTIFIGGGTPSSIDDRHIKRIIKTIYDHFDVSGFAEITIECNPCTVTKSKANAYKKAGINRISIGLQSANNEELKSLGRIHSFEDFIKSYNILREAGFDNINVDLMSATMGQTVKSYENTLKKVIELGVEHISSYSLIIEEGTPLYEATDLDLPSEEDEREMYYLTEEMLNKAGYRRYEISNYAKPDRECKHNISYWIGTDYIGFGIGAASLFENVRFSNGRDLQSYIDSNGLNGPCEEEELSENARMEEFMFLGLRMMEGISKRYFYRSFKTEFDTVYGKVTKKLVKQGLLIEDDDNVRLSKKGIDVSNYVMSEYLLDSEKIV